MTTRARVSSIPLFFARGVDGARADGLVTEAEILADLAGARRPGATVMPRREDFRYELDASPLLARRVPTPPNA